ncbi:MAG: sporulation protein [Mycobacteriales bacterium]
MKIDELMTTARDAVTVKRVFGEPYEHDGITVITAATVSGGGGGGGGHDQSGQEGEGGGFGVSGKPAGAYVIKDGTVTWRPAVNVNRLITLVGVFTILRLLTRARAQRLEARRAARSGTLSVPRVTLPRLALLRTGTASLRPRWPSR